MNAKSNDIHLAIQRSGIIIIWIKFQTHTKQIIG